MSLSATAAPTVEPRVRSSLMLRVALLFAVLAVVSAVISLAGRTLGAAIARAGHTDDRTTREVVIGDSVLVVPANMIRHERARRNGVASRLDLYLRWPQLDGYSDAARADFNHAGGSRRILFLAVEPEAMSRDMSGRLEPIYRPLIEPRGVPGPAGLTLHAFTPASGYLNETLAIGRPATGAPFVARCLSGAAAAESLAPCERDVSLGEGLSLLYRFPRELLAEWERLDESVATRVEGLVRTTR